MVLVQRIIRGPNVISEYLCGRCWAVWTTNDPRKKQSEPAGRVDDPDTEET